MNKSADREYHYGTPVSVTISTPVTFSIFTLSITFSARTLMMCTVHRLPRRCVIL